VYETAWDLDKLFTSDSNVYIASRVHFSSYVQTHWDKTPIFLGLSRGVALVIPCWAILIQYRRVTNGQTDGQTDRHMTTANTAQPHSMTFAIVSLDRP